jgi:phosphoglycerol transferase
MLFHIGRYIYLFFICNAFCIYLFSSYRHDTTGNSLAYLIKKLNIKYIATASFIDISVFMIFGILKTPVKFEFIKQKYLIFSLALTSFLMAISFKYQELYRTVPLDQLLFHIRFPVAGANFIMITSIVVPVMIFTTIVTSAIMLILSIRIHVKSTVVYIPIRRIKPVIPAMAVLFPVIGIVTLAAALDVPKYLDSLGGRPSSFYEERYINPANVDIEFPEEKRNLIVIFIESLETGFLTIENGGNFHENLMPEVEYLARENLNFSQNDGIGGHIQLSGTGWTIAGIASQYSGIPLVIPFINGNNYGILGENFMPSAYSLGDVLKRAGYKNYFILGSDAEFGARDKYFRTHGNTIIYDYRYFHDNNFIPIDYRVWWGFEDRKLYQFAKEKLPEISKSAPFFLTLLTVDTHPAGGYLDNEAEIVFDAQYKNVQRDMSRQLYDFVLWLGDQDFFENTTVVILGDHLYMDSSVFQEDYLKKADKRFPINIFINSLLDEGKTKNRTFSSFDIFPALVDSIGGIYNSGGLALGRSMNNGVPTLLEELGTDHVQNNITKKSYLYNTLWGGGGGEITFIA